MLRKAYFLVALPVILVTSLKITRFEVPSLLVPGDSAQLTCFYDLGEEKLFSVKWYKDFKEFFRYFPSLTPQYMAFPAPGIDVDLSKSGAEKVYLKNLTLETEGRYTCQVSADEPYFGCVQVHRDIVVYMPPVSSPQITGGLTERGDNLTLRCSSYKSKPAANLSFFVNDIPMKMVPGLISSQETVRHPDQLESSYASVSVPLTSEQMLKDSSVRFTCAATISNVVRTVSKELYVSRVPKSLLKLMENTSSKSLSSTFQWIMNFVTIYCIVMTNHLLTRVQ